MTNAVERYRESCVGFTPGWVDLQAAVASLERVVGGIPDLNARIDDLVSEGDKVYARLTVTGTNWGRFFGAPSTGRSCEVSMFDYARLEDGSIVERVQQSDALSQLRQIYAGGAKKAAAAVVAGIFGAAAVRPTAAGTALGGRRGARALRGCRGLHRTIAGPAAPGLKWRLR